jgi:DNA polymerase
MIMARCVVLDFETRSCCDLKKVGAWRYSTDPSTDVWCAGFAVDDEPVALWCAVEPVPQALITAAADPGCIWIAHNASFEIAIWRNVLRQHGWPDVPPLERWHDTMSMALSLALPPALDLAAKVLSLPEQQDDRRIDEQAAAAALRRRPGRYLLVR